MGHRVYQGWLFTKWSTLLVDSGRRSEALLGATGAQIFVLWRSWQPSAGRLRRAGRSGTQRVPLVSIGYYWFRSYVYFCLFLRTAKIAITRRTEQVCSFFMAEFDKVGASVFLQIGTPLWENTQIHRSRSTSELNCQGIDPRNLTLCISTFSWPRLQLEISRPDCLRFRFLKPHGNEVFCLVPWQHLATSVSSGSHH